VRDVQSVSPSSLQFAVGDQPKQITVTQSGTQVALTARSDTPQSASVGPQGTNTFVVTPLAVGSGNILISDPNGVAATVPFSVAAASPTPIPSPTATPTSTFSQDTKSVGESFATIVGAFGTAVASYNLSKQGKTNPQAVPSQSPTPANPITLKWTNSSGSNPVDGPISTGTVTASTTFYVYATEPGYATGKTFHATVGGPKCDATSITPDDTAKPYLANLLRFAVVVTKKVDCIITVQDDDKNTATISTTST
jgi:hypothetical protein